MPLRSGPMLDRISVVRRAGPIVMARGRRRPLPTPLPADAPRATDTVVLKWDEQLLNTTRASPPQTGPTVAARALAVVHTAMYDAWAAYDPTADPATPGAPGKQSGGAAAKEEAMSYAAYRMLLDLFPTSSFPDKTLPDGRVYRTPDKLMTALGYDPADESQDESTPAGVGNKAAAAMIALCHVDGANQLQAYADSTGYTTPNTWNNATDKWSWQPLCVLTAAGIAAGATPFPTECTAPNYTIQKPLTPQWKTIKPFGPRDPATRYPPQFALPGPNADGAHAQATADIDEELALTSNLSDVQ